MINYCSILVKQKLHKCVLFLISRIVSQLLCDQQPYMNRLYLEWMHSQNLFFWIGNLKSWAWSCVDCTSTWLGTGQKPNLLVLSMTSIPHHLVLGSCHNMSKNINSEKQRLLIICWVLQKQKHKKHNQPGDKKKLVQISSCLSEKNVYWIPVMKFALKFSF